MDNLSKLLFFIVFIVPALLIAGKVLGLIS